MKFESRMEAETALMYFNGPAVSDDFVNLSKEVVRSRIFWGMRGGQGVQLGKEYFFKSSKMMAQVKYTQ
jgi:hypothetical protein